MALLRRPFAGSSALPPHSSGSIHESSAPSSKEIVGLSEIQFRLRCGEAAKQERRRLSSPSHPHSASPSILSTVYNTRCIISPAAPALSFLSTSPRNFIKTLQEMNEQDLPDDGWKPRVLGLGHWYV